MANESTTSTLTGWLTTTLSKSFSWYAFDRLPAQKFVRIERLDPGSKIKAFSKITKDTALSGTITEATGLSNVALDTANASATVAEVGILRQFTKLAERTNMLGPDGLMMIALEDGAKMCLEKFETDVWGQFPNASTSVGTSGAAYTIANAVALDTQHTVNKSNGAYNVFATPTQLKNLRTEATSSGAAILGDGAGRGLLESPDASGYAGSFLGKRYYTCNLGTASGADTIGAGAVDGYAYPTESATGVALGWMPEPSMLSNPVFSGGMQVAVTMAYGMTEVNDFAYVKITTVT